MNNPTDPMQNINWDKSISGLLPAIVQDAGSGAVLMLAWMNPQSLQQTIETGKVTFFSRSREAIWVKGETSGHYLDFVSLKGDCDGDAILVRAHPRGPACHTGTKTCFGDDVSENFAFLGDLQGVIDRRAKAAADSSYTAQLLNGPFHRVAQKVGEEAVETILAATSRDEDAMIDEAADLVFHLMVMLTAKQTSLTKVVERLKDRHKLKTQD
ncbi:MAG: bifunctional phosphoribosyl-AMP cyclohydrolase/phosphoribosyl-ATP diphosphatase HisIE [Pirellulaceae bacterium]|nr:bifunctional phosphoribosyl-AMP cyclohydrolase/phosphoribosyl-ATP diphosphatase HisIE [Pirellulaceae bacterium]